MGCTPTANPIKEKKVFKKTKLYSNSYRNGCLNLNEKYCTVTMVDRWTSLYGIDSDSKNRFTYNKFAYKKT